MNDVHFNFNFEEVSKNKVYKSGVIPPEKIAKYIEEHQLKSVGINKFLKTPLYMLKEQVGMNNIFFS